MSNLSPCIAATLAAFLLSAPAFAADAPSGVPVTIDISEVEARPGPLYISIQTEDEYQSMRGAGGIIQQVTPGMASVTYNVPFAGRYAVSVWHDLDEDVRFSMDYETYEISDGWGASGDVDPTRMPTFDDVAIDVSSFGTQTKVAMFYPED